MLALESHSIAGHTLKLMVIEPGDGPLELEALRANVAERLASAPRGRQRVDVLVQFVPFDTLTASINGSWKLDDYLHSPLGLQEATNWSAEAYSMVTETGAKRERIFSSSRAPAATGVSQSQLTSRATTPPASAKGPRPGGNGPPRRTTWCGPCRRRRSPGAPVGASGRCTTAGAP